MPPVKVHVEAVQYTPDNEPVLIHWAGQDKSGPLSRGAICHTTQEKLSKRSGMSGYWSDVEIKAELHEHLNNGGVFAEVVDNVPVPPTVAIGPEAP